MASFFNAVGGLGNPFSSPIGQKIEQATDAALTSENWALNMEVCDMINESSDTARDAMKAIRKRLSQNAGKNNQVIMYTLTVLETCVKNCGKAFHVLVAQKDFIQELVKLIGPKNDPPAVVQEKVLSLIQIWADAFKNQTDQNGVTQMYMELKNKGIEFPPTDMEAMAPIYTPERSVPELQPQMVVQQTTSPQHAGMPVSASVATAVMGDVAVTAHSNGPAALTAEQLSKLQSELEIVAHSMSILSEMLSELKPGQEEPEDYALLNELTATCKEMQGRIVDLVGRVNDDELTAELLRLNDELNNLFLRHQRFEKNRSSSTATSPSAILGAAIGVPSASSATAGTAVTSLSGIAVASGVVGAQSSILTQEASLIDLAEGIDKLPDSLSVTGISAVKPPKTLSPTSPFSHKNKDVDEFDMLAQSRTDGTSKSESLLKNIPTVDAAAGRIGFSGSPFKDSVVASAQPLPLVNKPARESEVDEMEAWLGNAKEIEGMEETLTSTEFDKFLEERAAAAEQLPTITAINNSINNVNINKSNNKKSSSSSGGVADNQRKSSKKSSENDLLEL